MTLSDAFARSINTVAVQLSEKVGRKKVIEVAKNLGVISKLPNLPSIALGAADVSLLELTQAFAHIINGGIKTRAFGILQVKDSTNHVIYELPNLPSEGILSSDAVDKMKTLLSYAVKNGTGRNANLPFKTVYGKTGTSQDHKDAWFVGATEDLVVGVWVGNDDSTAMKHATGSGVPALIWKEFMEEATGGFTPTKIPESSLPWENTGVFDKIFGGSSISEEDGEDEKGE
jgi:penicillin-binding protein 1A